MKFVQEYCSICDKGIDMPVVQEDESHPGLVWVRCPVCHEIKPVEAQVSRKEESSVTDKGSGRAADESGGVQSRRVIRHYRSGERFSPGEWIYHSHWDDTGQIIEKSRSRGGKEVIVVAFKKMGTKRLVSNYAR